MPRKTIQKNLAYDSERRLYYATFHRDGRRYTRTYHSEPEALEALDAQSNSAPQAQKDYTLGQWLSYWLEEVVARDRAESTIYCYRNIIRCHVVPALGSVPLSQLTPLRIQTYLHEKMDQGLCPNTVHKHYVLLTTALGLAAWLELLQRSPMDRVSAPKLQETRYTFYTPAQLQSLFSAVAGTMLELPVKLAAYLGLRRSEICGLRWEHVDLDQGILSVQEVRTEVGGRVVAYAAGQVETAARDSSIQRAGEQWFELEELYVDRAFRNCGLGGRLLDHVEEELRREGIKRLMLSGANRDQGPLLRFYLRRGMTLYSFRAFLDL